MRGVDKYGAVLTTTLQSNLIYGHDVLVRAGFMLVVLVIFVNLWQTTFEIVGEGHIAGFSFADMVWYLVVTETIVLGAPRVSNKVDQEVKSGDLAYILTKPYNYVLYHFASFWGEATLRVPINFAVGSAVALVTVGPPSVSPWTVPAVALVVVGALTLAFAFEMTIGLLAFWFEDTLPFFWMYQKLVFSIGGMFLPLEFFPDLLAAVSRALPFAAITYAPARLFVGFSWAAFAELLALQLAWLAAMAVVAALVYRHAVRRVNVHGG